MDRDDGLEAFQLFTDLLGEVVELGGQGLFCHEGVVAGEVLLSSLDRGSSWNIRRCGEGDFFFFLEAGEGAGCYGEGMFSECLSLKLRMRWG